MGTKKSRATVQVQVQSGGRTSYQQTINKEEPIAVEGKTGVPVSQGVFGIGFQMGNAWG